jgi:hypothetical protein
MLTQNQLKRLLDYDPKTGRFTWRVNRGRYYCAGKTAGCTSGRGYRLIRIKRKNYPTGRLAFLWMTGRWPLKEVDHKNRILDDDRWSNLRLASRSQNCANRQGWKQLPKGVSWQTARKAYVAAIKVYGHSIFLGRFKTIKNAHVAYQDAARKHFGEFACFD